VITPQPSRQATSSGRSSDLDATGLVDHRALGERPEQAHQPEVLAAGVVAGGEVGDLPPPALVLAELADAAHALGAGPAVAAGGDEAEDHPVAGGEPGDARADLLDDPRALVPADHRQRNGQVAGDHVLVGMAQAAAADGDEDLPLLGRVELDLLNRPFLVQVPQHRGASLHASSFAHATGEPPAASQIMLRPRPGRVNAP
jgi:hypothetical protein